MIQLILSDLFSSPIYSLELKILITVSIYIINHTTINKGNIHEAKIWPNEESLRVKRAMRMRDRYHHIQ